VQVTVKNGKTYEGILRTTSPKVFDVIGFHRILQCNTNSKECFFSALTLLVGRQEGHPVCKKTEWLGAWLIGYLSGAICRFAYGPADATATHCLLLQ